MSRRMKLATVAVLAILALTLSGCQEQYEFRGSEVTPLQAAEPLDLTDQFGKPFSLADEQGKVLVVFFGYTTCPDICPLTLSEFITVKDELGDKGDKVRFVLVTVDPERDTPERLERYLANFDPTYIGLTGSVDEIEAAKRGYGVITQRVDYPESRTEYLVDHTSMTYVIDADGRLRLTYPYGTDPLDIAEDIRHLV